MRSYERCWKVLKTDFKSLFFTNLKVKKYRNQNRYKIKHQVDQIDSLQFKFHRLLSFTYNKKYKE